ncbi:MFS transporter [Oceanobacillus sp. AG]|uniref:MFS transporter n=1 Tax=Oceanobacillus sp. AG TaxID=2681969 RepID=UPI0012EC12A8|nr:MFS transporter [Oceanobacillus sp. AG]
MSDQMGEARAYSRPKEDKIWTKDFIFIWLANFFIFLGFQMTLPTLPLYVKELGGSDQMVGIIVGIFTFSALLLRPFAGHALETKGRGFVYIIGLAIFVITMGIYGFLASIFLLGLVRVIQGAGWGFSTTAGGTIATDLIPPKRRGEGMGYFGLSGNIALAMGPSLGLSLVGIISFRDIFFICATLGLTALLLSLGIRYKKVEAPETQSKPARFDVLEKTALQPSILMFFITATFGGIATFLPLHALERNVEGITMYFLVYAIFLMFSRLFAGQIYDKKGHLYVFIPGALFIFSAMLLLAWLPSKTILLTAAALYGFGFGTVQPALQAWAVDRAEANRKGMANATFFSFFDLGIGVAAIFFGMLASNINYASIYIASSISILCSIIIYIYFYLKGKRQRSVI